MKNLYVNELKRVVLSYQNQARSIAKEMKDNKARLYADQAAADNADLLKELTTLKEAGNDSIDKLLTQETEGIRNWGQLKGSDMNDDMKLLGGKFKLDNNDLDEIMQRNLNNATVLRGVADYAQANRMMIAVPTVEAKLEAAAKFAEGAKRCLIDIAGRPEGSPMTDLEVDQYGEDAGSAHSLFAMLGNN